MPEAAASEPVIHVMPERFYIAPRTGFSTRTILIVVVAVLFVAVVGGSTWYYLRSPAVAPMPAPAPVLATPPTPIAATSLPETIPPAPLEASPIAATSTVLELAPLPSADSDADGLTTVEEALFSTNPNNPDSDNDGYLDGHEVFNLYNPAGREPEKLEAAGLVKRYTDPTSGYQILYPSSWEVSPAALAVDFKSSVPGHHIQVKTNPRQGNQSLGQWVAEKSNGLGTAPKSYTTKAGDAGLMNGEGLSAYVGNQGTIFEIVYTIDENASAPLYRRTFEMMVNSLILPKP